VTVSCQDYIYLTAFYTNTVNDVSNVCRQSKTDQHKKEKILFNPHIDKNYFPMVRATLEISSKNPCQNGAHV